jgi:hypothetical protein
MELDRIRNDSESQIVFELVMIKPMYVAARIVQKSLLPLAAETIGWQLFRGMQRNFGFLLTGTQSELLWSSCDKRTSRKHGWCSSRLRVEPIFGQTY